MSIYDGKKKVSAFKGKCEKICAIESQPPTRKSGENISGYVS